MVNLVPTTSPANMPWAQTPVNEPAPTPGVSAASLDPMPGTHLTPTKPLLLQARWPPCQEPSSGHFWELQPLQHPLPAVGSVSESHPCPQETYLMKHMSKHTVVEHLVSHHSPQRTESPGIPVRISLI